MSIDWREWNGGRVNDREVQGLAKLAAKACRDAQCTASAHVTGDTMVVATRGPSNMITLYECRIVRQGEEGLCGNEVGLARRADADRCESMNRKVREVRHVLACSEVIEPSLKGVLVDICEVLEDVLGDAPRFLEGAKP